MPTTPGESAAGVPASSCEDRDVWITGVGLVSSLGTGVAAHREALATGRIPGNIDRITYAPYPVHRLADIRLEDQIPSKADLRQMGRWQQIGAFAAGLALDDAGLKGDGDRLAATDLVVAAGNGERDGKADATILKTTKPGSPAAVPFIGALQSALRPTLYLAELSNLLAGNISIVHGVTRSSRTFKGEEQAGLAAIEDAAARIAAGTSRIALVGGALNAERSDLHLSLELCGVLWHDEPASVQRRAAADGGLVLGSVGSFVVLEAAEHARARGARGYARVSAVTSSRIELEASSAGASPPDEVMSRLARAPRGATLDVLSGASGVGSAMRREMAFIHAVEREAAVGNLHFYGDAVGHGLEAHFPTGIALAAIALANRRFCPSPGDDRRSRHEPAPSPAERILVTGFGHWRGAGAALLEAVEDSR